MVRAFRIEHPDDRRGPFERFFHGDDQEGLGDFLTLCAPASAPVPSDEQSAAAYSSGRAPAGNWRFACLSVDDLRLYFIPKDSAATMLDAYGYVVAEYDVPEADTITGNRQVAFLASSAERIADHGMVAAFGIVAESQQAMRDYLPGSR